MHLVGVLSLVEHHMTLDGVRANRLVADITRELNKYHTYKVEVGIEIERLKDK